MHDINSKKNPSKQYAIGLMSGTSLDGLDICYCSFEYEKEVYNYEILKVKTIKYNQNWKKKFIESKFLSKQELEDFDIEFGQFLGISVQDFIKKNTILEIDFIASHGHTIFHQPEKKYTLQIGNGNEINKITDKTIVNDFRIQDVLLGGQGAPLVPIGDELLFSKYDACINLGGFSNISFRKNNERIAFDICPVNIVLNEFSTKLGKEFDESGSFAKKGKVNNTILNTLNNIAFYKQYPPKSLGREWVETHIFPLLKNETSENILATFTYHISEQISNICNQNNLQSILFTGGGTYNTFLLELIKKQTTARIIIPDSKLIEYKEALIFAFLGYLRLQQKVNVLSSVTGAIENHCSGKIYN